MNNHSTSETGHYKNLSSFQELLLFIRILPKYNPARTALRTEGLQLQLDDATNTMTLLDRAEAAESAAIKARATPFTDLPSFATRVVAELEAAVPASTLLPAAKNILAKLYGKRIGKIRPGTQASGTAPKEGETQEAPRQISVSQRSFDATLDHFDKLTSILEAEPEYATNHEELKVGALRAKYHQLHDLNSKANNAILQANALRNERQLKLYAPVTGLVDTAKHVKKAVLSAYNANSPEYKKAASFSLRTLNKR